MEQLTMHEWAKAQVKRAPSFAIATILVGGVILLSNFVRFSLGKNRPDDLIPVEAEIAAEEPAVLDEIRQQIKPLEKPDLSNIKPDPNAPVVDTPDAVPVDAPLSDVTVNIDVTEDSGSDSVVSTDPFPMEMTKKMAVIGSEPGTGGFRGALGNRTAAGKRKAGALYGMPREVLKELMDALRWLKKAQNEDGSWDVQRWGGNQVNAIAGVSGLALLAFFGYGCTDRQPEEFATTVRKAVEFIISRQHTEDGAKRGWFGERMYEQGICTMALSEASLIIENRALRGKAQKAAQAGLDYIISQQPSHGAFAYTGPGTDTSITGWQIMAIKSALNARLHVPKEAVERTEKWLSINMSKDYATPYQISPAVDSQGGGTPRMTGVSLACRLFMGHKRTAPDCEGQARFVTQDDSHLRIAEHGLDFYHIYYMSLAMFQMGGDYWKRWNTAFTKGLKATQVQEGPEKGSWPTEGSCFGAYGGRVYTTAMACLALEVYFRFLPMYKGF